MASRAADYIYGGLMSGTNRFLDNMERQKEEEKNTAKKFKALVAYAEATGMLTKEQAEVMDVNTLDGFVNGKMYREQTDIENAKSAGPLMAQFNRALQAENMSKFATAFNDRMALDPNLLAHYADDAPKPMPDTLSAFQSAIGQVPNVDPQDLAAFTGSMDRMAPRTFAPSEPMQMLQEIGTLKAGGKPKDAAKIEEILRSKTHPSGQERFDLNYSDQLLMANELDVLKAVFNDPLASSDLAKQAKDAKMTVQQLYQKRLEEIEKKYKSRSRKATPEPPKENAVKEAVKENTLIRVKSPDGKTGTIPASQLEEAKKAGFTVIEQQ